INFVSLYLYYSNKDKKYFFNFKRKQQKKRQYLEKILNSVKNNLINENNKEDLAATSTIIQCIKNDIYKEIIYDNVKQDLVDYSVYKYPSDYLTTITKKVGDEFGPFGTQWIHDIQNDDIIDEKTKNYSKQFDFLRAIKLPDQRT